MMPLESIHKQIMTDDNGRPVSVVIPYHEWLELERAVLSQSHGTDSSKLRSYTGAIPLSSDPIVYQRQLRDEWT